MLSFVRDNDGQFGSADLDGLARLSAQLRAGLDGEWRDARSVRLRRDDNAYLSGQHDHNIYLVDSGCIKTMAYSRDGKRCLLSLYGRGDIFGELGILPLPRTETACAMRDTVVRRMPVSRFCDVLCETGMMETFVQQLVIRSLDQQRVITDLVTANSEQRLAATLLKLARKFGTRQGSHVLIDARITQEDLSAMVGTTRSRVGLFLKGFRSDGLLADTACLAVNEAKLIEFVSLTAA